MVVSTDIRNLARDSSENAERIKDLVKGIQDQIVVVRRDLEEISVSDRRRSREEQGYHLLDARRARRSRRRRSRRPRHSRRQPTRWRRCSTRPRRASNRSLPPPQQAATASGQAQQAAKEQSKGAEELAPRSRRFLRSPTNCRTRTDRRPDGGSHVCSYGNLGTRGRRLGGPPAGDAEVDANVEAARQFVTFRMEKEIFAVPLTEVQEIIRLPTSSRCRSRRIISRVSPTCAARCFRSSACAAYSA